MGRESQDDLNRIQELMGRGTGIDEIFARSLRLLRQQLERRKVATTARPRQQMERPSVNPRRVPARVRRAVWQRDGRQCTYVSDSGQRCAERHGLELDHVIPVARGGQATIDNLRLRCRVHNQYAAEGAFGAGFMETKRAEARERQEARHEARLAVAAEQAAVRGQAAGSAAEQEQAAEAFAAREGAVRKAAAEEVIPFLRHLRFRRDEARNATMAACEHAPDASLEERVRLALRIFGQARFGLASRAV